MQVITNNNNKYLTCNICLKIFASSHNLSQHFQFTKSCIPKHKKSVHRLNFGNEDIQLIINELSSFSKLFSLVQLKKQAIVQLIDFIFFNPLFPQNQTIKYNNTGDSNILIWKNDEWSNVPLIDIKPTILKYVETIYIAFFQELLDTNTDYKVVLNLTNHISSMMFNYFQYQADNIDHFELSLIEKNKEQSIKNELIQKLKDHEEFTKYMDYTRCISHIVSS